ncbi:amino acid ABC transporter substrate-binding protein [Streptomyces sp. NA02950]|uniref:substrate-binding periplasmic protein n=1 Tax=Streptomyces sp. NA02950 TaxID=2742137 RepID=UPI00158FD2B5|nr:transporter substrate-binding domain-containing protein [Streptomyces sp. NA02950]QKV97073.1 amino acid ABC transporter substrate-binding protein [Streptomyces sp. NA02950]
MLTRVSATAACVAVTVSTLLLTGCGGSAKNSSGKVAADCKPAHTFGTVKPKTLTVGVISSLPYSSVNPVSGKWEGIDAEFGAAIAAKECLTVTTVAVSGADAIQSLDSGKVDLLSAGAYITPERGRVVGQTKPLYYQYTVVVSRNSLGTVDQLRGHQIGALSGSAYVQPLRTWLGSSKVHEYPSTADLLADVQNKRLDVAVTASGEAKYQLAKAEYTGLRATRLAPSSATKNLQPIYGVNMPYKKSNTALGSALNADIAALRAGGTTKKILTKWKQNDHLTLNGK